MLHLDPEHARRLERLARDKGVKPEELVCRLIDQAHHNGGEEAAQELFSAPPDIETMAEEQGVVPVRSFEDLLEQFWPEDDTEEFLATIREWRTGG